MPRNLQLAQGRQVISFLRQEGNLVIHDDFDLIRETVLMMKREGLTIDNLVSIARLEGFLKETGLKEGQIERMIDDLNAHLFKRGLSIEEVRYHYQ